MVYGLGFMIYVLGLKISKVQDLGFRVYGLRFRV
jgi:hypothetical protein